MFFLIVCLFISLPAMAQSNTIPFFDSTPVMPGFRQMHDSLMVFDKPEGKIAEISLICDMRCPSPQQVSAFYRYHLVALGWKTTSVNNFHKETQQLSITYSVSDDTTPSVILTFHSKS